VIDGDTIKVQFRGGSIETVRYLLMDTPEVHHPKRGKEEMGVDAWSANRDMVANKRIYLETDIRKKDKYGRLLAYVWLDDNKNLMVNEKLVESGFALPMTIPPNVKYTSRIHNALETARNGRHGLWRRAENRNFSSAQAWSELPYLKGNFITLEIKINHIAEHGTRDMLYDDKGHFSVAIYKSDMDKFCSFFPLQGKLLRIVGKVITGYHGGEMSLKDPLQIVDMEVAN